MGNLCLQVLLWFAIGTSISHANTAIIALFPNEVRKRYQKLQKSTCTCMEEESRQGRNHGKRRSH